MWVKREKVIWPFFYFLLYINIIVIILLLFFFSLPRLFSVFSGAHERAGLKFKSVTHLGPGIWRPGIRMSLFSIPPSYLCLLLVCSVDRAMSSEEAFPLRRRDVSRCPRRLYPAWSPPPAKEIPSRKAMSEKEGVSYDRSSRIKTKTCFRKIAS